MHVKKCNFLNRNNPLEFFIGVENLCLSMKMSEIRKVSKISQSVPYRNKILYENWHVAPQISVFHFYSRFTSPRLRDIQPLVYSMK